MKSVYILLILVLLVACEPKESGECKLGDPDCKDVLSNDTPGKAVNPEPVRQPLTVSLEADKTTGELSYDANLKCIAAGGDEDKDYFWSTEDTNVNLEICNDENCHLHVKEIGTHEVKCTVSDSEEIVFEKITLEVTKKKVYVDAIVNFGDSLTFGHGLETPETQNWAYLLSKTFENAESYNYAITGATTFNIKEGQLTSYEEVAGDLEEKEKIMFLWVGANDIKNFISVQDFTTTYNFIVDKIKEIPNARVIIINVPDVSKLSVADDVQNTVNSFISDYGVQINLKKISKDVVGNYNTVIKSIADENNIPVIDMFSYQETFEDSMITKDRFHPNELGHTLIVKKVQEELESIYPKIEFI